MRTPRRPPNFSALERRQATPAAAPDPGTTDADASPARSLVARADLARPGRVEPPTDISAWPTTRVRAGGKVAQNSCGPVRRGYGSIGEFGAAFANPVALNESD